MNNEQAREILKTTFENAFNKDNFIVFIKNLLNRIEEAPFTYQGNYIPDAYKQYIKKFERIGKYSDRKHSIDILVVTLKKDTSLERARTMQRNFIAWYLNGSRGDSLKDAALVAYISPDEEDWRFSLVKMDYKFEETPSGNIRIREEITSAKRWSFLVGANEKSHTVQSRLIDILDDDEHNPTLQELENAFDIETVTEEFFIKYRDLFIRTKEELDRVVREEEQVKSNFDAHDIDTVNFAKKLLGQITFLYFLQKKGWFGVPRGEDWGTGSKHFLRELFDKKHGDYDNFFNDIMEPLFYEALRNDRRHDDHYYSRFNCKIPFLNGGLFDPIGGYDWVDVDIKLSNTLFSNTHVTREGDIGDGILDIFDRYNFTVREDEPLEKEVAIDPELLGKTYEKFNAIRPDNFDEFRKTLKNGKKGEESKFNKKFGVYYTPREIVHYMCQQSLINYLCTELNENNSSSQEICGTQMSVLGNQQLKLNVDGVVMPQINKEEIETLIYIGEQVTENEARVVNEGRETRTYSYKIPQIIRDNANLIDQKLADITVCDPAVGSGAFPVGMMNEIVRTRNVLSTFIKQGSSSRGDYAFKRHCIEHSLYGVDIDPGAVEIAKLRLWLSLVVDEEDIDEIRALPNLDYKIMQGDSLIAEFMGINFDEFSKGHVKYLGFEDKVNKLLDCFESKKIQFLNESNVTEKLKLKKDVEKTLIEIFELKVERQETEYSSQLKEIKNTSSMLPVPEQRKAFEEEEKKRLRTKIGIDLEKVKAQLKELHSGKKVRPFFFWSVYFAEIFRERGGFDIVIANPPYIQLQKLRGNPLQKAYKNQNFEVHDSNGDIYCLFYEKGVDILKKRGHLVFITSNKWMRAAYGEKLRRFFLEYNPLQLIDLGPDVFESATVDTNILVIQKSENKNCLQAVTLSREDDSNLNILSALQTNSVTLKDLSQDTWFIGSNAELKLREKIERVGTPLKEWDVKINYGIKTGLNEAFIIDTATHDRLVAEDPKSAEILKPILRGRDIKRYSYEWAGEWLIATDFDIDVPNLYPAIFNHLLKFEEKARKRDDKGKNWWNLRACSYYPEFEKEKIVWIELVDDGRFAFVEGGIYAKNTTFLMTHSRPKYLVGCLNSSLINWYFDTICASSGTGTNRWIKRYVEQLPVPIITPERSLLASNIERLIESVITQKKSNSDITSLEKQIDQLVYQLYDLTPEEIAIVERANMK